jgi:8-oxo-dGTP pyrophosphatase MutT (NUDIX family)
LLILPNTNKIKQVLRPISDHQEANAAVGLILIQVQQDFKILFVKRVERLSDPWSGQIAFPGGKKETKDSNLKDTVIRETFEETNIKLDEDNLIGVLEAIDSGHFSNIKILPFISLLKGPQIIKLNKKELDNYFWYSYKKILNNRSLVEINSKKEPAYILGDKIVWGITYKILREFCEIIEKETLF